MSLPQGERLAIRRYWQELRAKRNNHFHSEVVVPSYLECKKVIVKTLQNHLDKLSILVIENDIHILRTVNKWGNVASSFNNSGDELISRDAWTYFWMLTCIDYSDLGPACPDLLITPKIVPKSILDTIGELYSTQNELDKHGDKCNNIIDRASFLYGSIKYMLAAVPELKPVVPERYLPPSDWKPNSSYKVPSRDIFVQDGLDDPVILTTYFGSMSMEGCL